MRLARSQPELPGNGCFLPLLHGHLETSLEPALPAILLHKDEGADGTVTRPGGWQPGRPAHNPRVESWPPLDRAGVTAGARSMPPTRTRHEPA